MVFTPMIEQYLSIKKDYKDAFLFFRLGDFYELFFDDALSASRELEITLTSRDGGSKDRIPMCGVPYHAAAGYITILVEKGYKVAICEQVEDPKEAKGVVKREVIQLITPGTVMEGGILQPKENNYLAALAIHNNMIGLAFVDLTTGESKVTQVSRPDHLVPELLSFDVKELVCPPQTEENASIFKQINGLGYLTLSEYATSDVEESLFQRLFDPSLTDAEKEAFKQLLNYLVHTQKRALDHLQPTERYEVYDYMRLNRQTKRNLELTSSIREKKKQGSLLWLLDRTKTAMGGRKLKQWIEKPLIELEQIKERLNTVEALKGAFFEREALRESLEKIYDLERLVGRIAYGNVNARELIQLKASLSQVPAIKDALINLNYLPLKNMAEKIDPCEEVYDLIEKGIMDEPPISVTDGGLIKDGYQEQLDQYREVTRNGKAWLAALESQERQETGIKSLKIGFNKVFGYYIEVTRSHLKALPEGRYERKQTLANAERFITPELKEKERLIMDAEDKKVDLEYSLFHQIREKVKAFSSRLQTLASLIASLDVLQSFATVSDDYHYTKPSFTEVRSIRLIGSRHPVVEKVLREGAFVSNDVLMPESSDVLLITGPNMGGKSTFMRQVALSAIMAQIGCFVPAEDAVLPIFDQIFTRIGATDDLASGQSTFMVEMVEAQEALSQATPNSLILLDEIGRGTSTYDGIAIAQAIVEFIHDKVKAKTLFSTHYHELTGLDDRLERLVNVHVSAMEEEGRVVFLHKVMPGNADKSYGIHVAELADLPSVLISRATEILTELESKGQEATNFNSRNETQWIKERVLAPNNEAVEKRETLDEQGQLSLFEEPILNQMNEIKEQSSEWESRIKELDLLNMTPMEAMNVLYECQRSLKKTERKNVLARG
jgi:DNA mismatch repair protein MutS